MTLTPLRSAMQRRFAYVTVCTGAALAVAACSGPAGVELGHNWSGAETFVLARVDNLTTVVGIDPKKRTAEPLVVVPAQKDDDDVNSPSISHLASDRWIVTIPKKDGSPSRLYSVDKRNKALEATGTIEGGRTLIHAGTFAVAVGAASRASGKPDALLYDPENWRVQRLISLPVDPKVESANRNTLCIAGDNSAGSTVVTIPLDGSTANVRSDIPGSPVQAIDCSAGEVTIAQAPKSSASAAVEPSLQLSKKSGMQVVTTSAGRIDQLFADDTSITVAVSIPKGIRVITIQRRDGGEVSRANIDGFANASAMQKIKEGWLVFSGSKAALVKSGATDAAMFSLPGQLLAVN